MTHLLSQRLINPALNQSVGNSTYRSGTLVIQYFIYNFINLAIGIGGLYLIFNLIRGGYEFIMAGGDKEALSNAQKRLRNALVGVVIILSLYAFLFVLETLFGINLRNIRIPNIT